MCVGLCVCVCVRVCAGWLHESFSSRCIVSYGTHCNCGEAVWEGVYIVACCCLNGSSSALKMGVCVREFGSSL